MEQFRFEKQKKYPTVMKMCGINPSKLISFHITEMSSDKYRLIRLLQ